MKNGKFQQRNINDNNDSKEMIKLKTSTVTEIKNVFNALISKLGIAEE